MNILVSATIPTRGRVAGLARTYDSLFSTALIPDRIEVVLRVDDDDQETINNFQGLPNTKLVIRPRGGGYGDMPVLVSDACQAASGVWTFLIDDDAYLEGWGWDDQLSRIKPDRNVAQPEFYHLGFTEYGSGSCGPNGLFIPTDVSRKIPRVSGYADSMLEGMTIGQGWTKVLLKGITYCHDGRPR